MRPSRKGTGNCLFLLISYKQGALGTRVGSIIAFCSSQEAGNAEICNDGLLNCGCCLSQGSFHQGASI